MVRHISWSRITISSSATKSRLIAWKYEGKSPRAEALIPEVNVFYEVIEKGKRGQPAGCL